MLFIFGLSSQQKIAVSQSYWLSFLIFKTLHVIEYGILFLLWDLALFPGRKRRYWAFVLAILYGGLDELHQHFVPTRHGCLRDVFIDALGIFITFRWFLSSWRAKVEKVMTP